MELRLPASELRAKELPLSPALHPASSSEAVSRDQGRKQEGEASSTKMLAGLYLDLAAGGWIEAHNLMDLTRLPCSTPARGSGRGPKGRGAQINMAL